jgi:chemotaxis protein CheX
MSDSSVLPKSYRAEDFLSTGNLDRADSTVTEIFKMMFGFDIKPAELSIPEVLICGLNERTAVVGFSGAVRGSCQIRMTSQAATSIASAMLGGAPIGEDDDSVNDALGELCNMLAGGWKNGTPGLASECVLSPPTVISGRDYKVHMSKPSLQVTRRYQFDIHALHLTLCLEDIAPPQERELS